MPPRYPFRLEIAGQVISGTVELDSELRSSGGSKLTPHPPPRPAGRPSFDAMIAAAVTALEDELAACDGHSARTRLVLRHLAEIHAPEDLPKTSTVRAFFAERSAVAEKSANKSKRARIRRC
jgi:hypothetical protein